MMNCNYCDKEVKLVSGKVIYPHLPELKEKLFWYCKPCKAYVGCHGRTNKPLGRLANAELRSWKIKAHNYFDNYWRKQKMCRDEAYDWLAIELKIKHKDCHIGMFDVDKCKEVVSLCNPTPTQTKEE